MNITNVNDYITEKRQSVIVTTEKRGVFFGYIEGDIPCPIPSDIKIYNARNCVYWSSETKGFLGLASIGPQKGSRIGPPVEELSLNGITSCAKCSTIATKQWEEGIWS